MEAPAAKPELPVSFAGALAAFATDDGLADDIAVLSYESAVRTQAGFDLAHRSEIEPLSTNQSEALDKKSASITIRMSHTECTQLRQRAAAAGLSVSAYMRSCILEAETLRAQVKEALAELRTATPEQPQTAPSVEKPSPRRWWRLGARSNATGNKVSWL